MDDLNHTKRSVPYECTELVRAVKATREQLRETARQKRDVESRYLERIKDVDVSSFPYGVLYDADPFRFILATIQEMNQDETYQYEVDPPKYDGEQFIVSTANVNEYQGRFFGPLPHDEIRLMFRKFYQKALLTNKGITLFRSSVSYDPSVYSTGLRMTIPVDWLNTKE